MKVFSAIALVVFSSSLCAKDVMPGMNLGEAKRALYSKGWKPSNPHRRDGYQYIGVESELLERGYFEVENCAIDGALCVFVYKKNGRCKKLITRGEEVNRMKVIGVMRGC